MSPYRKEQPILKLYEPKIMVDMAKPELPQYFRTLVSTLMLSKPVTVKMDRRTDPATVG